jgi:hypothetical protein
MIRELILVSGDLAAAPWFARGTPPSPPMPDGISIEVLSKRAPEYLFSDGPVLPAEAAKRLADSDTCHVALTSDGAMAAQMWCTERPRFIDWIGCNIRPPEGHVHVYNSWVRPEFRGLGLQWNLASSSCEDIMARGRTKMCAGVERKEYPPFARKYAAMGLGLVSPYKSIWAWQIFGIAPIAIPCRPPRVLESSTLKASKHLARHAERQSCESH